MEQKELKLEACKNAYNLISTLDMLDDDEFVDDVLNAVMSNDPFSILEMIDKLNRLSLNKMHLLLQYHLRIQTDIL